MQTPEQRWTGATPEQIVKRRDEIPAEIRAINRAPMSARTRDCMVAELRSELSVLRGARFRNGRAWFKGHHDDD